MARASGIVDLLCLHRPPRTYLACAMPCRLVADPPPRPAPLPPPCVVFHVCAPPRRAVCCPLASAPRRPVAFVASFCGLRLVMAGSLWPTRTCTSTRTRRTSGSCSSSRWSRGAWRSTCAVKLEHNGVHGRETERQTNFQMLMVYVRSGLWVVAHPADDVMR